MTQMRNAFSSANCIINTILSSLKKTADIIKDLIIKKLLYIHVKIWEKNPEDKIV